MQDHAPRLAPPLAPRVAQRRERDAQLGGPGGGADGGARLPGEVGREIVGIVAEPQLRPVEHAVRLAGAGRDPEDHAQPATPPRLAPPVDAFVARTDVAPAVA